MRYQVTHTHVHICFKQTFLNNNITDFICMHKRHHHFNLEGKCFSNELNTNDTSFHIHAQATSVEILLNTELFWYLDCLY